MEMTIQNLEKTYSGGVKALNNISLKIPKGLFGLLGPNGAGKSTLMRILATLQNADSGQIYFRGINVKEEPLKIKEQLGYLPQNFGFFPGETAEKMLNHFARLKGYKNAENRKIRVRELLQKVNLLTEKDRKLGTFSGGMKQRFAIALVLLGNPRLIIVDEPTAGLDPEERVRFHNILSEIGENIVIILSTHIVEDVSDLCPNMAIIHKGEIILADRTELAINRLEGKIWKKEIPKDQLDLYENQYNILSTKLYMGRTFINIFSEENPGNQFLLQEPGLEEVYFFHLKQGVNEACLIPSI